MAPYARGTHSRGIERHYMNAERLVAMASQISQFFESQPTREGAVAVELDNIKRL